MPLIAPTPFVDVVALRGPRADVVRSTRGLPA